MIIADDDVDPDEVAAAEKAYGDVVGQPLPAGELARSATDAKAANRHPSEVLQCLPTNLEPELQEKVLGAAFQVASADGFVLEEEDELLQAVAKAVGMDAARARTVLASFMG
jgi:DnaJ-domain-containing protein 1